jgi:hypothetical protein
VLRETAGLVGGNRLHLGRRRRPVLVVVGAGDFILLIENLIAEEVGLASELKGPLLLENRYLTVNGCAGGLFDLASDTLTGSRARLSAYCGSKEKSILALFMPGRHSDVLSRHQLGPKRYHSVSFRVG